MEIKRPETREEMLVYMEEKDLYETIDFLRLIVANGWAEDIGDAEIYLDTLGLFPWEKYKEAL